MAQLEDIPPHYLIMHQFFYQAERDLRQETDVGPVGFTGRTRQLAQRLRELGWRRADYNRESLDDEGNPIVRKQINRDSFWFRPEHWQKDEDMFPPVAPKSAQANEFFRSIRRGRRIAFPVTAKEQIMDALVGQMSGGKVTQWYGGSGGHERMKAGVDRIGAPAAQAAEFPKDVDPWLLVPEVAFLAKVRKDTPEAVDVAEKGMGAFGWKRSMPGNRDKGVWYNPEHWEPAVGGELGLLPLTDEAQAYSEKLPPSAPSATRRFLPDIALLVDIEELAKSAVAAGKSGRGPAQRPAPRAASQRPAHRLHQDPPSLDDIDAAGGGRPRPNRAELPGQAPGLGAPRGKAAQLGHSQRGYHQKTGRDTSDIDEPDDDDIDQDDDAADDDIENMTAAELDRRSQERFRKAMEKERGAKAARQAPVPKTRPAPKDDDDEPIFADDDE